MYKRVSQIFQHFFVFGFFFNIFYVGVLLIMRQSSCCILKYILRFFFYSPVQSKCVSYDVYSYMPLFHSVKLAIFLKLRALIFLTFLTVWLWCQCLSAFQKGAFCPLTNASCFYEPFATVPHLLAPSWCPLLTFRETNEVGAVRGTFVSLPCERYLFLFKGMDEFMRVITNPPTRTSGSSGVCSSYACP